VTVGSVVRVDLRGRRVRGWVTATDVAHPGAVELAPVRKVTGAGPPASVLEVAGWAAWRWAGRRPHLLRVATARRAVALPAGAPAIVDAAPPARTASATKGRAGDPSDPAAVGDELAVDAWRQGRAIVRSPPAADDWPLVLGAVRRGRALIIAPSVDRAEHLALRMGRAGVPVARYPEAWVRSAEGAVTIGARAAAWAPVTDLASLLVLDEHDEAHRSEAAPTWHARDVVTERAAREGAACVLSSPAPSLAALSWGWPVLRPSRIAERAGWPVVEVVDRRREDPTAGEWCSPTLARYLTAGQRLVAVVNRIGRARLAVCRSCGELARSDRGRALALEGDRFADPDTAEQRPVVCANCGSTAFRRLRLGTEGVATEVARMARRPVLEVTAASRQHTVRADLVVGTEAALHRVEAADVVVFVDFDQELLAPRYRAAEEAMALLVRAARLVGSRAGGGRVVVQTRMPRHPVLDAALHADPGRMVDGEMATRQQLGLPPAVAMALVSGAGASAYVDALTSSVLAGVEVRGPADGRWQVLAPDHRTLCDALAAAPRPAARLRVEVDPLRA